MRYRKYKHKGEFSVYVPVIKLDDNAFEYIITDIVGVYINERKAYQEMMKHVAILSHDCKIIDYWIEGFKLV